MKALITGINGFVGRYLAEHLITLGFEVSGTTRSSSTMINSHKVNIINNDLSSIKAITELLNITKPDHIYHLAGQSNVRYSWDNIEETFQTNTIKTINLLEAIKLSTICKNTKILTVGSSEEYGPTTTLPVDEETILQPSNPYGLSKSSLFMIGKLYYHSFGLQIIHARPFNHIGPFQSLGFVTADFAKQVVDIEKGIQSPLIKVGNLNSQRDFTDVRDIVIAYYDLLADGEFGQVYNICSSKPVLIRDILKYLISQCTRNIEVQIDETKFRPVDIPIYIGSNEKIRKKVGWSPKISIEESLDDILDYWRKKLLR
ncbi:GDP-mannose 4,6-dehydratase [Paenibacillus filicis]|uniref:GDP-mannose 4,6-dehydratase n=1 Tax=Paenibacillus gyeongsangnamensis TaxID=3388067 RepID=A0ABT4Q6T9_9BACL|nr:GDP-mannose 4,6-dehydratase [Paenibacillus filicis]MCZ8512551.1 GDP-mannose 4,6-dehydratase [Paenibacillus filicis]